MVLRPGETVSTEDLQAWCKGKLADNKTPRTILLLEALPYNPNGKVLKRELQPVLEAAAAARKAATA